MPNIHRFLEIMIFLRKYKAIMPEIKVIKNVVNITEEKFEAINKFL